MGLTMSYTAALFFVGLGLFSCSFAEQSNSQLMPKDGDDIKSASPHPELEPLSPGIFLPEIIELLSPKMFQQPDPVLYLVKLVAKKPYKEVLANLMKLRRLMWEKNGFPPRYLPYANVLLQLLNCRRNLEDARVMIIKVQASSDSTFPSLPSGLLSPELSDLFSTDIFSDEEPPFELLIRLANIPEDKVNNVRIELRSVFYTKNFPDLYFSYAKDLWMFMKSEYNLPKLVRSISELRDFTNSKFSVPV